jgi:hypothetical protein
MQRQLIRQRTLKLLGRIFEAMVQSRQLQADRIIRG